MKFDIYQSADKTGYLLDFLITRESLKLVINISNQFIDQHYLSSCYLCQKCRV